MNVIIFIFSEPRLLNTVGKWVTRQMFNKACLHPDAMKLK